ncbi:MAG: hypothetical protein R6V17_03505 [Halanaerobacter sp.]
MNSPFAKFSARPKVKLLVCLIFLAAALWTRILFFSSGEKEVNQEEKVNKTKLKRKDKQEEKPKPVNLSQIYGGAVSNKNPFSPTGDQEAEFIYQTKNNNPPLDLKEVKSALKLKGIINHKRAIIEYQGRSLLLNCGAEVGDYKIIDIAARRVVLSKGGRKYFASLEIEKDEN